MKKYDLLLFSLLFTTVAFLLTFVPTVDREALFILFFWDLLLYIIGFFASVKLFLKNKIYILLIALNLILGYYSVFEFLVYLGYVKP
jgi:hypothetical protein